MIGDVLLDTHVFLWAAGDPDRLGTHAREVLEDRRHEVFVSAASIWEIAIKRRLGKLRAPKAVVAKVDQLGFRGLPITLDHAHEADGLPLHHRDPFDRMLVAQAIRERLVLVTHDALLDRYAAATMLV